MDIQSRCCVKIGRNSKGLGRVLYEGKVGQKKRVMTLVITRSV